MVTKNGRRSPKGDSGFLSRRRRRDEGGEGGGDREVKEERRKREGGDKSQDRGGTVGRWRRNGGGGVEPWELRCVDKEIISLPEVRLRCGPNSVSAVSTPLCVNSVSAMW
jgi:hypothetical protein